MLCKGKDFVLAMHIFIRYMFDVLCTSISTVWGFWDLKYIQMQMNLLQFGRTTLCIIISGENITSVLSI